MRLAVAVLLALFFSQAVASPASAALEACTATCPDDGPDGSCGPACFDCTCCPHAARSIAASPGVPVPPQPPSHAIVAAEGLLAPASDPQDVFHVPRPDLA